MYNFFSKIKSEFFFQVEIKKKCFQKCRLRLSNRPSKQQIKPPSKMGKKINIKSLFYIKYHLISSIIIVCIYLFSFDPF